MMTHQALEALARDLASEVTSPRAGSTFEALCRCLPEGIGVFLSVSDDGSIGYAEIDTGMGEPLPSPERAYFYGANAGPFVVRNLARAGYFIRADARGIFGYR